jgi:outer membrane protein TolC
MRAAPRRLGHLIAAGGLLVLGGCATYSPKPLPEVAAIAMNLKALQAQVRQKVPQRVAHRLDFADGLDLTEVAILAVINNPQLKARRSQLQVAQAQTFAAGLLPDPQLGVSLDHPTTNAPDLSNAFALGLSYDLIPLIARGARRDAARAGQRQVRLDIMWLEWQTIQQARTLALRSLFTQQRLDLLHHMRELYQNRYTHSTKALAQGDTTLGVSGTDLTALLDTFSQINQLEQSYNEARHTLDLLLGLSPGIALPLATPSAPAAVEPEQVQSLLESLPQRRPDLLALRAGYTAQEAKVRAAILAQFPSLSVGPTRARDTSSVDTIGFSIGLTLPLFSGNRGNIAVERATRGQLRAEYATRLTQTASDVDQLLALQQILLTQQRHLETYLPRLGEMVAQAGRAYQNQDIDALTFLNMEATWINKRLEEINLRQTLWENRVALNTLLATPEGAAATLTLPEETTHDQRP